MTFKVLMRKFKTAIRILTTPSIIYSYIKSKLDKYIYRIYAMYLFYSFDSVCRKITKNPQYMIIEGVISLNEYFEVGALNNTLQLILYSLYKRRIPVIRINENSSYKYQWEWFFIQPYKIIFDDLNFEPDINENNSIKCEIKSLPYPDFWEFYLTENNLDYKLWSFLFKKFIKLNDDTQGYIDEEIKNINIPFDNSLGVLVRGTDYTSARPMGHPIQPPIEDVISKCKHFMSKYGYEKLYIATEDRNLFDEIANQIGVDKCLQNERTYYSDSYEKGTWLKSFYENKENEYYKLSIQYLSSLIILSRCNGLVAGNCGGTKFVRLFSDSLKNIKIFFYGFY